MTGSFDKWVACWGTATSISDRRECGYAKDITFRYPVLMCFDADRLRFHFSNFTGTEAVTITKAYAALKGRGEYSPVAITFGGGTSGYIEPGGEVLSDSVAIDVHAGDTLEVSIYLGECTQMNAGTLVTGPLSKGSYSYGDYCCAADLPVDRTRSTNWFYFLNTIDAHTSDEKHALICYGDSITAQSWPDYLSLRCREQCFDNVSIIRRAVCGSRILRQYDCVPYQAYGLKGAARFPYETEVAGADAVIVQHGINDIIHPVGTEVNPFRPWSDLPSCEELIEGVRSLYIAHARSKGMRIYSGTLLPIEGWRTYVPMRDELRCAFNDWLRTSPEFDGCVDFDAAVRNPERHCAFAPGFDSGDHLHPSEAAYKAMAECVSEELLK